MGKVSDLKKHLKCLSLFYTFKISQLTYLNNSFTKKTFGYQRIRNLSGFYANMILNEKCSYTQTHFSIKNHQNMKASFCYLGKKVNVIILPKTLLSDSLSIQNYFYSSRCEKSFSSLSFFNDRKATTTIFLILFCQAKVFGIFLLKFFFHSAFFRYIQ